MDGNKRKLTGWQPDGKQLDTTNPPESKQKAMNENEIKAARHCVKKLATNHDVDINTLCFYADKALDERARYREALESIELHGNLMAASIASEALGDE